jgi:tRNA splicing ligase
MPIKLSNDLLWRVIYLNNSGKTPEQIALLLFIGKTTVTKTLANYSKWKHIRNPFISRQGQRKLFNYSEMEVSYLNIVFIYYIYITIYFIS